MKLSGYISGVVGLFKDFVRFVFGLILRPHYVAAFLLVFFGIFYLCGIHPADVPAWFKNTFGAFIEARVENVKEDISRFSEKLAEDEKAAGQIDEAETGIMVRLKALKAIVSKEETGKKNRPEKGAGKKAELEQPPVFVTPPAPEGSVQPVPQVEYQEMFDETFGWNRAFEAREDIQDDRPFAEGPIVVVGGDRIRIGQTVYSLAGIRLRSGKFQEAYTVMRRKFNGITGRCYFEKQGDTVADCRAGDEDLSGYLLDYDLADEIR